MRVFSIVGNKDTGKTTLTTRIIKELIKRGNTVGTVKHSHHTMVMDKENTDTFKHKSAGATTVVGIGSTTFFNIDEQIPLNRILFLIKVLNEPDYVIIEGFKDYPYPKISCSKNLTDEYTIKTVNAKDLTDTEVVELTDMITKYAYDIVDTLQTRDCGYINTDEIAQEYIKENIKLEENSEVSLAINDKNIRINPFVNDFIKSTIEGMLKSIKTDEYGIKDFEKIEILIKK